MVFDSLPFPATTCLGGGNAKEERCKDMEELRKWRIVVCVLLAALFVLPGWGPLAQNVSSETETNVEDDVDHSVWLDNETAYPGLLMVWIEDGDVYFSSTLMDYYTETLENILGTMVEKRDTATGGEHARYNRVIGHVEQALDAESVVACVDSLAKAVVLLETLQEDDAATTIFDLVQEQSWLNLLYNENQTLDTTKALEHYSQAQRHMEGGRRVAAMQAFVASFRHMPTSLLGWDNITRLSYSGSCSSPIVYWNYSEAQDREMLHAGWVELVDGKNHTMYARSTNLGRTWWVLDASQYAEPYLRRMGRDFDFGIGDWLEDFREWLQILMRITRLLEKIWIIDGCHHFYSPIENGDYVPIGDPDLTWPGGYSIIDIGGHSFFTPICGGPGDPGGTPNPEPLAPDLTVDDIMFSPAYPINGVIVEILVSNKGDADIVGTVSLDIHVDDLHYERITFTDLFMGASKGLSIQWEPNQGNHFVKVTVDPLDEILEGDESNNVMGIRTDFTYAYFGVLQMVWERPVDGNIYFLANSLSPDLIVNPWRISRVGTNSLDPQIVVTQNGVTAVSWIEEKDEGNRLYFANSYRVGKTWYYKDVTRTTVIHDLNPGNIEMHIVTGAVEEVIVVIGGVVEIIIDIIRDFSGLDRGSLPSNPSDVGVSVDITYPPQEVPYYVVSDTITITGTTTRPVVNGATLQIEGVNWAVVVSHENPSQWNSCTKTGSHWETWEATWDTTTFGDGDWKIVVEAIAGSEGVYMKTARDQVVVTVDNQDIPPDANFNLHLGSIHYNIQWDNAEENNEFYKPEICSGTEYDTLYAYPSGNAVVNAQFMVSDVRGHLPGQDDPDEPSVHGIFWNTILEIYDSENKWVAGVEDGHWYGNAQVEATEVYHDEWIRFLIFPTGTETTSKYDGYWCSEFREHRSPSRPVKDIPLWHKQDVYTNEVSIGSHPIEVVNIFNN